LLIIIIIVIIMEYKIISKEIVDKWFPELSNLKDIS